MTSLRQLRKEATDSLRAAKSLCGLATKEAKLVAGTRCEFLKANELRLAKRQCTKLHAAAEALIKAYQRARPEQSPARKKATEKRSERLELSRRDAVARVAEDRGVPLYIAQAAVRKAERRGGLPAATSPRRWESLADRVTRSDIADAWSAHETKEERAARKRRPEPEPEPDVVILVDEDFADDEGFTAYEVAR